MRVLRTLALAAPLVLGAVACKKNKAPEPAPAAKEMPDVAWKFGPASFSGSRAEGNEGTLKVPVSATNNSDTGFVLKTVRVGVMGASGGEACTGKKSMTDKAPAGAGVSALIELPCAFTKLPAEGKLSTKITVMYTLGGVDKEEMVEKMVRFDR